MAFLDKKISERQLELGPAGYFRVRPASGGTLIQVDGGAVYSTARGIWVSSQQSLAAPAVVALGTKRYDLVHVDKDGVAGITTGTPVPAANPVYDGAPGWMSGVVGPALLDNVVPLAYVLVDETGSVVIDDGDIVHIGGLLHNSRALAGYFVDKGTIAAPSGTSDDVSSLFTGESSGGNETTPGVITNPHTAKYCHILDQNNDEIIHNASGARIYGWLDESGGIWTFNYKYRDASGAEQTANITNDPPSAPTSVKLAGVPKVYSMNDPSRPLFANPLVQLSDQVVGDIPQATVDDYGKVRFAHDGESTALEALQSSDSRIPSPGEKAALAGTSGTPSGGNKYVTNSDPRLVSSVQNVYFATYTGVLSLGGGVSACLFESNVVQSGVISTTSGTGVFTVSEAGFYEVICAVSGVGVASYNVELFQPSGNSGSVPGNGKASAIFAPQTAGELAHGTFAVILNMTAFSTFNIISHAGYVTPGGLFKSCHIAIKKL